MLDEPTSALDPTAAEEVLATLTRLVHDLGLTVLLAEHRLERVVPFADRIALLTGDGGLRSASRPTCCRLPGGAADHRARPCGGLVAAAAERARGPAHGPADCGTGSARRPTCRRGRPDALDAHGLTVTHGHHVAVRDVDVALRRARSPR